MELLINELLKLGAHRERLKAKVFGGARMVPGFQDIGSRNAQFAMDFLRTEHITCLAHSTGGNRARRIRFDPITGIAKQQLLQSAPPEVVAPKPTPRELEKADSGDLELL